jgi:toxin-antitoxin system PIN domain toxin
MSVSIKSFLVDVNVWLAMAYGLHVHHGVAARWFETLDTEQALFCRLTQLGLLRLLTNPKVMGVDVMSGRQAWREFDNFLGDERVSFLTEPSDVDLPLRQLTNGSHSGPNVWSDAYLGAVAKAAGLTVVTMDRVFAKMPGVEALILRER